MSKNAESAAMARALELLRHNRDLGKLESAIMMLDALGYDTKSNPLADEIAKLKPQ